MFKDRELETLKDALQHMLDTADLDPWQRVKASLLLKKLNRRPCDAPDGGEARVVESRLTLG